MAQHGLYEPDEVYQELEDLIKKARSLGATMVDAHGVQWLETPTGPKFQATCVIRDAEGCEFRRDGYANHGDAQVEDAPKGHADIFVETRAETRALRNCIRTAFPDEPLAEGAQPAWMKRLQITIRDVAAAEDVPRDEIAAEMHRLFRVASTADLTPQQADAAMAVLVPRLPKGVH